MRNFLVGALLEFALITFSNFQEKVEEKSEFQREIILVWIGQFEESICLCFDEVCNTVN